MSMRDTIASSALNTARIFGRALGTELVVETSQHSIETKMEVPDREERAWDPDLYKHGQLYYQDYANPIKPTVDSHSELEDPDTIDVREGETQTDRSEENGSIQMIASPRYRKYMRQDLISQLLTPKEQWKLIAYGVLGLGVLQFLAIAVTLYATGSFG